MNILNISGGKDSSYLIKHCFDLDIKVDKYLFRDCGLELPCVYKWLNYLEKRFNITIERIKPTKTFKELFYRKITRGKRKGEVLGFPFVIQGCWIQRDLKFRSNIDKMYANETFIIGYCAEERRTTKEVNAIYPLVDARLSSDDVIQLCKKHNLYPPIYSLLEKYGVSKPRSGCWLCPKGSIGWFRMIYNEYPVMWKELLILEKDSPHGFKPNMEMEFLGRRFGEENKQIELFK